MADDCLFCKIIRGELPSTEVYADDEFYAFRDVNPVAPTHILIVPRKHISRIMEAGTGDDGLLGRLILRANETAVSERLIDDGFRYVINCNEWGGQTVFHIHLHILGGRPMAWPPG